jgi:hypothetical protein
MGGTVELFKPQDACHLPQNGESKTTTRKARKQFLWY